MGGEGRMKDGRETRMKVGGEGRMKDGRRGKNEAWKEREE